MEDLSIGSEITLKVIETEECSGCFFDDLSCDINENVCKRIKCGKNERKDRKNVQFRRVK
jgi:hypothetical protein